MLLAKNKITPNTIIFEDQDLLIIDKAPQIIVNQAQSHQTLSLQTQIAHYLNLPPNKKNYTLTIDSTPEEVFQQRQGMVHRLDKNTSGLLVWAKNPFSLQNLLQQFQQRQVEKKYLALTHGLLKPSSGRIFLPLARKKTNRQIMAVSVNGRDALTTYQVLKLYPFFATQKLLEEKTKLTYQAKFINQLYQGFSLVEITLHTGRTHQIRAHFTHLKHPLVGDSAYLSAKKAKIDPLWCPRQFLHAHHLTFMHPISRKKLNFTSPLPSDLQKALNYLSLELPHLTQ